MLPEIPTRELLKFWAHFFWSVPVLRVLVLAILLSFVVIVAEMIFSICRKLRGR